MSKTAGIVLAGGESRRMGVDKTRLMLGGRSLVQCAVDAARPHCSPLLVVLGRRRVPVPEDVVALQDDVFGQGPLRGLATGLAEASRRGASRAVVLSADLPLITPAVVEELLGVFEGQIVDVVLAESASAQGSGARTHPLVGVYATALAAPAARALDDGERKMLDFVRFRRVAKCLFGDPFALVNVNTPEEWEAVTRLISER